MERGRLNRLACEIIKSGDRVGIFAHTAGSAGILSRFSGRDLSIQAGAKITPSASKDGNNRSVLIASLIAFIDSRSTNLSCIVE